MKQLIQKKQTILKEDLYQYQPYSYLPQFQNLVLGMDYELMMGARNEEIAREIAQNHLNTDPNYYSDLRSELTGFTDFINKDQNNLNSYQDIDLGSGMAREFGSIGVDLYQFDPGTLVHDVTTGLPFSDQSALSINANQIWDDLSPLEQQNLISEIDRCLIPGGLLRVAGQNLNLDLPSHYELLENHSNEDKNPDSPFIQQLYVKKPLVEQSITQENTQIDKAFSFYQLVENKMNLDTQLALKALGLEIEKGGPGSGRTSEGGSKTEKPKNLHESEQRVKDAKEKLDRATNASDQQKGESPKHEEHRQQRQSEYQQALDHHIEHLHSEKKNAENKLNESHQSIKEKEAKINEQQRKLQEHHDHFKNAENKVNTAQEKNDHARNLAQAQNFKNKELNQAWHQTHQELMSASKELKDSAQRIHHFTHSKQIGKSSYEVSTMNPFSDVKVPILKMDEHKKLVYGIVLSPDEVDSQGDWMNADDIEEAAHHYMQNARVIGSSHEDPIDATPVESYIAPFDMNYDQGPYGPQTIKKGSWILGVKIKDSQEWQKVMNGEYQGFSVGGYGVRG